ncbi:MAG TPA: hypothetical protein VNS29_15400 [Burkholderiaceae bacterium]|nr:hypothetical protein [Burkholderiaceae bacterium]
MTDREMLELAAKAAGIERGEERLDSGISLTEQDGRHRSLPRWNPLDDDGDALRLAIACDLTVCTDGFGTVSAGEAFNPKYGVHVAQEIRDCADKFAAVRRAIVRAAAEIGKRTAA